MVSKKHMIKPLAAAALLALAGASQASITVYNTQAAFLAATTATGVDTFAGLSIIGSTPSPLNRTAGVYSYTADATPIGTFFGAGTTADPWLSTNQAIDTIVFNGFSGGVQAIGGNFFGSSILGTFAAGDVTLVATELGGGTSSLTIAAAAVSSFRGFVSTTTITSLTVCSVQVSVGRCALPGETVTGPFIWPTVDNLTMGLAAAVPEPQTYGLMLAGLGFIGFVARRRRG